MTLKRRLSALEKILNLADVLRTVCAGDGDDIDAVLAQYRRETGYRGIIVAMDEADMAL